MDNSIKEYLNYDAITGVFTWIKRPKHSHVVVGNIAGVADKRYWRIGFNNTFYLAHRLAYWWITGEEPKEVDHENNDTFYNAFSNLRAATRNQNARNSLKPINNTSGFKGVTWSKQKRKWVSYIYVNNKRIHLGTFGTPEEAHNKYCEAAKEYHKEFANFG